jgi:hypothetical protein
MASVAKYQANALLSCPQNTQPDEGRPSKNENSLRRRQPIAKKKTSAKVDPLPTLASEVIKIYAAKQKIKIKLTQEQLNVMLSQWNDGDQKMPAEVTFYVAGRPAMQMKVAAYRYRGDTCCV